MGLGFGDLRGSRVYGFAGLEFRDLRSGSGGAVVYGQVTWLISP